MTIFDDIFTINLQIVIMTFKYKYTRQWGHAWTNLVR